MASRHCVRCHHAALVHDPEGCAACRALHLPRCPHYAKAAPWWMRALTRLLGRLPT
jgi:hypothetical protein